MYAQRKVAVDRWRLYRDDGVWGKLCGGYGGRADMLQVVEEQLPVQHVATWRHQVRSATDQHNVSILYHAQILIRRL